MCCVQRKENGGNKGQYICQDVTHTGRKMFQRQSLNCKSYKVKK